MRVRPGDSASLMCELFTGTSSTSVAVTLQPEACCLWRHNSMRRCMLRPGQKHLLRQLSVTRWHRIDACRVAVLLAHGCSPLVDDFDGSVPGRSTWAIEGPEVAPIAGP